MATGPVFLRPVPHNWGICGGQRHIRPPENEFANIYDLTTNVPGEMGLRAASPQFKVHSGAETGASGPSQCRDRHCEYGEFPVTQATKWVVTWHYEQMRNRDEVSEFAIELNRLCASRWPGGSRTANAEIADWVTAETGRNIDRQFVWRIRKGRVMKVDGAVRDAICSFFGVSKEHFSSSPRTLGEEVQAAIEETGLQVAGLRADQLSSTGRAELASLLREVSRVLEAEKSVGQ